MKDRIDSIIIKIWQNTDDNFFLKKFSWFSDLATTAAERQIAKAKHQIIKSRWEAVKLQNKLDELKKDPPKSP